MAKSRTRAALLLTVDEAGCRRHELQGLHVDIAHPPLVLHVGVRAAGRPSVGQQHAVVVAERKEIGAAGVQMPERPGLVVVHPVRIDLAEGRSDTEE